MSEVAGRMAIQVGATCLEKAHGGMGILLGGVAGVPPAKVAVLGSGVVGTNAARMAVGAGALVYVLGRSIDSLRTIERELGPGVITVFSSRDAIEEHVLSADLVVGAVLVAGAATPKLVSRDMVKEMKPGAALVDVSIDQGGCFETSRPTTHADPTYVVDGVVHYCVANMPGAVPRTSTYALNNATLPFVLALADKGWKKALADDEHLRHGLNIALGRVTHPAVSAALNQPYIPAEALL
jgi:alanine dehydrogenase